MPLPQDGEPDGNREDGLPTLPGAEGPEAGAELWFDLLERWIGASVPPATEPEAMPEPLQPPPPPPDDIWG